MKKLSPLIKKNMVGKIEVCPYCLQKFTTQEKLDIYKIDCIINHAALKMKFTNKEKLEFTNHQKQIKNPFVMYAEFESTLDRIDTCQPNPSEPFPNQIQKQTPNSFCVYTKCEAEEYSKLEVYTQVQTVQKNLWNIWNLRFIEYTSYRK